MRCATRSGPDGCCSSQLFQCFSLFWSLLFTKLKYLRKYFVQPDKLDDAVAVMLYSIPMFQFILEFIIYQVKISEEISKFRTARQT